VRVDRLWSWPFSLADRGRSGFKLHRWRDLPKFVVDGLRALVADVVLTFAGPFENRCATWNEVHTKSVL